jgi:tetratricopeptide (TPR) repeat protein
MDERSASQLEQYQILYQKNPNSKVFATLVDIYRKNEMLEEALELGKKGALEHPQFAGGRVALARVYIDLQRFAEALEQLEKAVELSAENLLAYSLLAECYLKLRQPKKALNSYKMVLLLNPNDQRAQEAIKKLESLTADEYEDEVFSMRPLQQVLQEISLEELSKGEDEGAHAKQLERVLSLVDAFIVRNDSQNALETLQSAQREMGEHPEFTKRLKLLRKRQTDFFEEAETLTPLPAREKFIVNDKIKFLRGLLSVIKAVDLKDQ